MIAGRTYAAEKLEQIQQQPQFDEEYRGVLRKIESAIVAIRRTRFRDLTDTDIKAGLELAIKTNETLDKGVIYEFKSPDPKIQGVTDAVQSVITEHQDGKGQPRINRKDAIRCLRHIQDAVKIHQKRETGRTAYLDHVSQFV